MNHIVGDKAVPIEMNIHRRQLRVGLRIARRPKLADQAATPRDVPEYSDRGILKREISRAYPSSNLLQIVQSWVVQGGFQQARPSRQISSHERRAVLAIAPVLLGNVCRRGLSIEYVINRACCLDLARIHPDPCLQN